MNIYASPASQRNGARHAGNGSSTPVPHEIKYRQDAANYVAAMLAELRQIAGKAGFDKLVKSLDTAYYEAYGVLDAPAKETAPAPRTDVQPGAEEKTSNTMEPNGS